MGVNKTMGFRKGERPVKFHPSLCISNIPEPLNDIIKRPFRDGRYEVVREGFPAWVGKEKEFVKLYMKANGGPEDKIIRRIEFEHYTAGDDPTEIQVGEIPLDRRNGRVLISSWKGKPIVGEPSSSVT